jgi:acetoin utilization deacetylase AcuC-like enzyme
MITVYPAEHALHAPPNEWLNGVLRPAHESPQRAEVIRAAVERAGLGPITPPRPHGLAPLAAVHAPEYLRFLEGAYERWVAAGGSPTAVMPDTLAVRWMGRRSASPLAEPGYFAFDLGAAIVAGTWRAAGASADAALTAADLLLAGERAAYALCRPPGHHAGHDLYGGYCFLNNAAIAAEWLLRTGAGRAASDLRPAPSAARPAPTVAILDIDYHHGNGTQQIFYGRRDVLVVSLHADPDREYPYFAGYADERGAGDGLGFNRNIPLPAGVDDAGYLAALDAALAEIAAFAPAWLVVSAGFDTFGGDPIGDFALTGAAYPRIGRRLAALGLPTLFVQEGGYAIEALGENVVGLLRGFEAEASG